MRVQSLDGQWQLRGSDMSDWITAVVPGNVHVDLIREGLIPDPAANDNEVVVSWVAESDWAYRRTFVAEPALLECDRVFLECDGIDTLATIMLNGEDIGDADNMHRRFRFDVTGKLTEGSNHIEVHIASPVEYALKRVAEDEDLVITPSDSIPGSPYVRKAMYQWGWDWSPKIPTSGIWRSIRLTGGMSARLGDIRVQQVHGRNRVEVHLDAAIERFSDAGLMLRARLTAPDGVVLAEEDNLGTDANCGSVDFLVDEPKLWWPNGYGEQPLYNLAVWLEPARPDEFPLGEILGEGEWESGRKGEWEVRPLVPDDAVDSRVMRIGLRELHLRREKDEWGESFYFEVNGVPIFAKGANWIPSDQFPARVTTEQYHDLVQSTAWANMNMLRIWGGGIYEDDRFYDLCDERGILIWQDFMFAGAHYPASWEMMESIRLEAVDNIRRIRHHPCLALWCGNNEMEWFLARGWTPDGDDIRMREFEELFYKLLPEIVKQEDTATPYWPSSPASGVPFQDPNGENEGDGHYWEVWHGRALFTAYRQHFFRFMSEFGFQSLPSMTTVASFAEPKDWNIVSYVMEAHQKSYIGNQQIIHDMVQVFCLPSSFPMLVYVSQILQAEAIRYGVEHWRRHRNNNRCMGTIYWQINDCWPVASWSSIEYNHHWKALHYLARRFFAPVLLSVEESASSARLHVTNDMLKPFVGELRWTLEGVDGNLLDEGSVGVEVSPGINVCPINLDYSDWLDDASRKNTVLVYELWQDGKCLSTDVVAFIPTKHVELPDPRITWKVFEEDGVIGIKLTTAGLARFIMLEVPDRDIRLSDNFFDLPAGRTMTLTVEKPDGLTAQEIAEQLCVVSLKDSY